MWGVKVKNCQKKKPPVQIPEKSPYVQSVQVFVLGYFPSLGKKKRSTRKKEDNLYFNLSNL